MIDDAGDPKYGYFVPADEVRVSRYLEMDFKDLQSDLLRLSRFIKPSTVSFRV
jgi:hypothetical protein